MQAGRHLRFRRVAARQIGASDPRFPSLFDVGSETSRAATHVDAYGDGLPDAGPTPPAAPPPPPPPPPRARAAARCPPGASSGPRPSALRASAFGPDSRDLPLALAAPRPSGT